MESRVRDRLNISIASIVDLFIMCWSVESRVR